MDSNIVLGIALGRQEAVAAVVDTSKPEPQAADFIFIKAESSESGGAPLGAAIARAIRNRNLLYKEAVVSVRSDFYAQYPLRSSFCDPRQIDHTIKYDAEEAAAADASTLAVAYEILNSRQDGSDVMVYAADRQTLTDLLLDLQGEGVDPVMMEPEAVSLARALDLLCPAFSESGTLFVWLCQDQCLLLKNTNKGRGVYFRRVLLAGKEDLTEPLMRQIQLTLAGWSCDEPIESVVLTGQTAHIRPNVLSEKLSHPVTVEDVNQPGDPSADPTLTSAAWGAALAAIHRGRRADFRRDFMPYQGQRKLFQKSLRLLSVSLTVILAAVGLYFQMKSFRLQHYITQLDEKLAIEYKGCMYGQAPPAGQPIVTRLRNVLRQARQRQEGFGGGDDNSVPARLTFLLEALNKTPPSVDMQVQQISITERTLRLLGDTDGRRSTLLLLDEFKKHPKLEVESNQISPAPPRDKFEILLQTKKEGGL